MRRYNHGILLSVLGAALLASGLAPAAMAVDDTTVDVGPTTQQYARFYPRKDGYRDTVAIGGTTNEPATVTIRIYNSAGTRVKSFLLGPVEGAYSATWNGRKKDGSLFPQGTYTVRHQYEDAVGNRRSEDRSVVLSHKKLYWYLGSQTRYADTGAFFTGGDGAARPASLFTRGIELYGGTGIVTDSSWAEARYVFTLPTAHVYASVRMSVYGKSVFGPGDHEAFGEGHISLYNFDTSVRDGEETIGYPTGWYETSVPAQGHVTAEHKVQTWARAKASEYSIIQKVKLTYKYGLLDD